MADFDDDIPEEEKTPVTIVTGFRLKKDSYVPSCSMGLSEPWGIHRKPGKVVENLEAGLHFRSFR